MKTSVVQSSLATLYLDLEILKIKVLEEYRSRHRTSDDCHNSAMLAKTKHTYSRTAGGSTSWPAMINVGSQKQKPNYKCGFCKKKGHKEANCFKKKKSQEEAKSETSGLRFFTSATTNDKWCLDRGSTSHICGDESKFKTFRTRAAVCKLASDATATIRAKGDVNTSDNALRNITLKDTLYVPNLRSNLVSVAKVVDAGFNVNFGGFVRQVENFIK
ncbi:hypothetical protein TKK_0010267 [Trichogramma kaykai]